MGALHRGIGMTTPTVTLAQIVDARKVLAAVEAHARRGKKSMAAVRALHGVLDAETARLAAAPLVWDLTAKDYARKVFASALVGEHSPKVVTLPRAPAIAALRPLADRRPWWRSPGSGELVALALAIVGVAFLVVYLAIRLPV